MPFEARSTHGRTLLMMLGSAAFIAGGLWALGLFGPLERQPPPLIGWAAVIFFGLAFFAWGARLFRAGPQVRIDERGIWSRDFSGDIVPWSEIENIGVGTIKRQRFLVLKLRDPSRFERRPLARLTEAMNRGLGFGDMAISLVGTDGDFDAMLAAVEHFDGPARAA